MSKSQLIKVFIKTLIIVLTYTDNSAIIISTNEARKRGNKMMNWKVIGTICPSKFEETKESVIAEFKTLVNAEDFISLVLPKETRDRFRIEHI